MQLADSFSNLFEFLPFHENNGRFCVARITAQTSQWVITIIILHMFFYQTARTIVNSYCFQLENSVHEARYAGTDALSVRQKTFQLYGLRCRGQHNTTYKQHAYRHVFYFVLIIIITIKQRKMRPSTKGLIETFSKYLCVACGAACLLAFGNISQFCCNSHIVAIVEILWHIIELYRGQHLLNIIFTLYYSSWASKHLILKFLSLCDTSAREFTVTERNRAALLTENAWKKM